MSAPKPRNLYGEASIDRMVTQLIAEIGEDENDDMIRRLITTSLDMDAARLSRLELKIASQALAEMLNGSQVFERDRERAKCTVFGSARTTPDSPNYAIASEFCRRIAERDWMIISGAGPGVMTAAIEGAGVENSYGVNIVLPFEADAADIIAKDPKLATFKYFFTRKLYFMKESDAFVLLPGGFGTLDEGFELLTLIQTGKSYPAPIVLLDAPGSSYWNGFKNFIETELGGGGNISPADTGLYFHTHDPAAAASYVCHFYTTYHSIRYVGKKLVIRLNHEISDESIAVLNEEFSDIFVSDSLRRGEPTPAEVRDQDHVALPRLILRFNNRGFARLHAMIRRINDLAAIEDADARRGLVHDVGPDPDDLREPS
ncbi:MAG: LOG family protein [Acidimicrobiales bacterium]|nr:LOG family protein [Acidimicrobiales bacterium]